MKANEHLLPIPVFRLLLTLTPYAKTTHSSIFYMLPFSLVVLIPFAYSPAAKNCSLIKSPHYGKILEFSDLRQSRRIDCEPLKAVLKPLAT